MTRKRDLPLPSRTPAYVSREVGAAELCISVGTWDDWVKAGVLPPPTAWLGPSGNNPRWRWKDVDSFLCGRKLPDEEPPPEIEKPQRTEPFFREATYAPSKKKGGPRSVKRQQTPRKR